MLVFISKRILSSALTLFFLLSLTFFLLRLAPGGPFDSDHAWPPEIKHNIDEKYGLSLPLYAQYWTWLKSTARGDLRDSFQYLGRPVAEIISEALGASTELGFLALSLAVFIGVSAGALAGFSAKDSTLDRIILWTSVTGLSLPNYLVAGLLVIVFSLKLRWLPPALWEGPDSVVLPVITLSLRPAALLCQLARSTVQDAIRSDYVRTARAKGVSESMILFKHVLRNALIPIVTLIGPLCATLITGSFIVELIFQIPGLGKHFVSSIINRDYPLVMGLTLVYGIILLGCNLLVDLSYGWIDPRIRR